jgi:hypothetical protein
VYYNYSNKILQQGHSIIYVSNHVYPWMIICTSTWITNKIIRKYQTCDSDEIFCQLSNLARTSSESAFQRKKSIYVPLRRIIAHNGIHIRRHDYFLKKLLFLFDVSIFLSFSWKQTTANTLRVARTFIVVREAKNLFRILHRNFFTLCDKPLGQMVQNLPLNVHSK